MKSTQIGAEVFNKNGVKYTKFSIGVNIHKPLLEKSIMDLGGKLTKNTKNGRYYELEGNRVAMVAL